MELAEMVTCPTCNGSGQTLQRGAAREGYDEPDYMDTCGICGGTCMVPASMFSDEDDPEDECDSADYDDSEPYCCGLDECNCHLYAGGES